MEYALTIPLHTILDKSGLQPTGQTGDLIFYPSPFGTGSDAVLHISPADNSWYDSSTQSGGDAVALVCALLAKRKERCSKKDALHWLKFNIGYPSLLEGIDLSGEVPATCTYHIQCKTILLDPGLIRYLSDRDIDTRTARVLFKQLYLVNEVTGKEFLALGFKNEEGGYAIYNPHTTGCIGSSAITFIRGRKAKPRGVHVFKDIFGYRAVVKAGGGEPLNEDSIILNNYANLDNAAAYIRGYGYRTLTTWFDNSNTGNKVTAAFRWLCTTEENLNHQIMQRPTATS